MVSRCFLGFTCRARTKKTNENVRTSQSYSCLIGLKKCAFILKTKTRKREDEGGGSG